MNDNESDGYGYGIGVHNRKFGKVLEHIGGIGSYRTHLIYIPNQDLTIVILLNISADFGKLEAEHKAILKSLEGQFPDENERQFMAMKQIEEKYPNLRGAAKLEEQFRQFLGQ